MEKNMIKEKVEFVELTVEEIQNIQGGNARFFDKLKQFVVSLFEADPTK